MTDESDLQRQLEGLLGEKVNPNALPIRNWWSPAASYTITRQESYVTWINLIAALPKRCDPATILDASGVGLTGNDGKRVFRLRHYVCLWDGAVLLPPTNVVATARTSQPVFVTVEHSLVNNSTDVEIKIATWDANGAPAAGIAFDWRCRVLISEPILIGATADASDAPGG